MNKWLSILAVGLLLLLESCSIDTTLYPPEPFIEYDKITHDLYQNVNNVDTLFYVVLYFSLIDGDGDIGEQILSDSNTLIKPKTNCFINLYYNTNDGFVKDTLFKVNEYTIPYIESVGQDKTIKADIKIEIPYSLSSQLKFPYDSLFYSIAFEDRAKNRSNIIYSDTIKYGLGVE